MRDRALRREGARRRAHAVPSKRWSKGEKLGFPPESREGARTKDAAIDGLEHMRTAGVRGFFRGTDLLGHLRDMPQCTIQREFFTPLEMIRRPPSIELMMMAGKIAARAGWMRHDVVDGNPLRTAGCCGRWQEALRDHAGGELVKTSCRVCSRKQSKVLEGVSGVFSITSTLGPGRCDSTGAGQGLPSPTRDVVIQSPLTLRPQFVHELRCTRSRSTVVHHEPWSTNFVRCG